MRKPITPYAHGVLDYATSAAVAAAPRVLGFPTAAANACYALAASYTSMSMITDYPLAVKRLLPFKAHGVTEGVIGAFLPALPWVLGFGRRTAARNFFIGLAALTAVVAAGTDWNKKSERVARRRHRRRPRLVAAA
jgi:hypothetical protein